jgi:hypothetical protein
MARIGSSYINISNRSSFHTLVLQPSSMRLADVYQTLGLFANIRAVLGDNPLLWCWPNTIKGDGLRFPVSGGGKWVSFSHGSNDRVLH